METKFGESTAVGSAGLNPAGMSIWDEANRPAPMDDGDGDGDGCEAEQKFPADTASLEDTHELCNVRCRLAVAHLPS
jgi:hypothetical protein